MANHTYPDGYSFETPACSDCASIVADCPKPLRGPATDRPCDRCGLVDATEAPGDEPVAEFEEVAPVTRCRPITPLERAALLDFDTRLCLSMGGDVRDQMRRAFYSGARYVYLSDMVRLYRA